MILNPERVERSMTLFCLVVRLIIAVIITPTCLRGNALEAWVYWHGPANPSAT